eukprot:scaffold31798_cov51-Attheya_sp.AAC.1
MSVVLQSLQRALAYLKGNAVWNKKASNKGHDADGYSLYQLFGNVIKLEKNVRIDPNDRDAVILNDFQIRLRDGLCTEEDVKLASHTGRGKKFSKEHALGLLDSMYLAVGAKILVTQNITTYVGMCNGSTGVVKDIVYAKGVLAPSLPQFVIGPERRSWVPIKPVVTYSWYTPCSKQGFEEHSRTMLPLTTAWAFTIWKSHGQTFFGKVVLNLSNPEKEHGLTYVAFSHATRFSDIGLKDGITDTHLRDKIREQGEMWGRIQHERDLSRLYEQTKEWMATYYE